MDCILVKNTVTEMLHSISRRRSSKIHTWRKSSGVIFDKKLNMDPPAVAAVQPSDPLEFTNVPLETEHLKKKEVKKVPRRLVHFSDGIMEEYSTDEEEEKEIQPSVDPKTLTWMPWVWYYFIATASGVLKVADTCGEKLAYFFGITSPKYQYAIDEYYRLKDEEVKENQLLEKENSQKLSSIEVESKSESHQKVKTYDSISQPVGKY